jgi:hypothetical protein
LLFRTPVTKFFVWMEMNAPDPWSAWLLIVSSPQAH